MWQQVQLVEISHWHRSEVLQRFWTHLRVELRFRTLLYYRLGSCDCWFEEVLGTENSTTLLWTDQTYPHYLRHLQDMDILAVVCLRLTQYRQVLHALSLILDQIRSMPVVLQHCGEENSTEEQNLASALFRQSQELKFPNVLLLSWNFFSSKTFYAFEMFPELQVKRLVYHAYLTLFPHKLGNLRGHGIRTFPDNSEPHTIVQKGLNGSFTINGPVWEAMLEFARHINGSLELAGEPVFGKSLRYVQVLDLVRNQNVDISASLRPYGHRISRHMLSYPMMVGNWCLMLPTERSLSSHEALSRLMDSPFTWLILLLLYMLHKLITQRTRRRNPIFHLLKPLAHLALLCFLQAQLSAYFIAPQQVNHITNMQQVEESGLKIRGLRQEFMEFPIQLRSRYATSFLLHDLFYDLAKYRNSFNTSYGYTVTSVKWQLYKEAQLHFRRRLFRYSEDICVQKLSLFSLIYESNCLYRQQLKEFNLRLHEAGLIRLWYRHSYYLMVKSGRFLFGDISSSRQAQPITWSEWQYVVALYGVGILFSTVVFTIELTVHWVNVCLRNL
ncbi:uncharacterized protein LOC108147149 [Drosophila elegans]|uniref:uncharacterized protein LOC108147149 n=1 Tax=Drosophila elegans TaxID=30023 RepID=UPI0007E6C9F8|nr:uncharacterized protein LOC108147149 [Drosophila elegans]